MACDPQSLTDQANCIAEKIPPGMQMPVLISLMCQFQGGSSGGGNVFFSTNGPTGDPNGIVTAQRPAMAYDLNGGLWVKTNSTLDNIGWEPLIAPRGSLMTNIRIATKPLTTFVRRNVFRKKRKVVIGKGVLKDAGKWMNLFVWIVFAIFFFLMVWVAKGALPPPIQPNPVSTNKFDNVVDGVLITGDNALPLLLPQPGPGSPFLRVNDGLGGTIPSWQAVILGTDTTGILPGEQGGTDIDAFSSSVKVGSLLYSAFVNHWQGVLAPAAIYGPVLISQGPNKAPTWSTNLSIDSITNLSLSANELMGTDGQLREVSYTVASPLTLSGTTLTFSSQNANTVFAGPAGGAAAAPTFRALVWGDGGTIPTQSVYNASPPYNYGSSNGVLTLRRGSTYGLQHVEAVLGSGGASFATFGNQFVLSGTGAAISAVAGIPGGIRLFSAATSASIAGTMGSNPSIGWNTPTHYILVGNFTNTTSSRFCCGFTSTTLSTVMGSSDPNTTHSAFIQYDSSVRSTYTLYTSDGATSTKLDTGVTATTNLAIYELNWDRVNNAIVAFRNGAPIGTNSTHLPAAAMKSFTGVFTGQNQAIGVDIYYMEASQDFSPSIP